MYKALLLSACCFFLSAAAVQAGEATSKGVAIANLPYRDSAAWYEAHRSRLFDAANAAIVEDRGNGQYVLRTKAPLGNCTYLVQETAEAGDQQTVYRIEFQESLTGQVTDQSMTVTLSGKDDAMQVGMSLYVKIDNKLAPSFAVKAVTDHSIRQAVKYVKEHAR